MKEIIVTKNSNIIDDIDYLEKIYKQIPEFSLVKFNGKAYRRIRPRKNRVMEITNHFIIVVNDIYNDANIIDADNEEVSIICNYVVRIK